MKEQIKTRTVRPWPHEEAALKERVEKLESELAECTPEKVLRRYGVLRLFVENSHHCEEIIEWSGDIQPGHYSLSEWPDRSDEDYIFLAQDANPGSWVRVFGSYFDVTFITSCDGWVVKS